MTASALRACALKKSMFSVCARDSVATCQYCGRAFCLDHGVVQHDGQEICTRKECVAKRDDLLRHLAYKTVVGSRNDALTCGINDCGEELAAQCVRCQGFFCGFHVHGRDEPVLENRVKVVRTASLCEHCWARRGIWTKT
jgi:hypothetical protein